MTSLMTSQGPDPLSVRTANFPKVGDHRVKISAQSDKKCRRRSILKKMLDAACIPKISSFTCSQDNEGTQTVKWNHMTWVCKDSQFVLSTYHSKRFVRFCMWLVVWRNSKLNAQKTEFIWCAPTRRHHIPNGDVQVWPRLSSSGPVSKRPRCVRRWCHDDEDSHQPCLVVILQRFEAEQIYNDVAAITRAKHDCHCSGKGSQPVGLLQCCFRRSSSLWHPATTVSS